MRLPCTFSLNDCSFNGSLDFFRLRAGNRLHGLRLEGVLWRRRRRHPGHRLRLGNLDRLDIRRRWDLTGHVDIARTLAIEQGRQENNGERGQYQRTHNALLEAIVQPPPRGAPCTQSVSRLAIAVISYTL
ncbi:hypothetical protein [Microbulbifer taiwanensis]|uniref:hypothetical protein n=1 Tax=Microbulbifer taiwanensis TaxID=986746 RepID=UPI0036064C41